jgi:hypothetical protein
MATNGATNGSASAGASKRFELPTLGFNPGESLTEGTDIPPPAPEEPPVEAPKSAYDEMRNVTAPKAIDTEAALTAEKPAEDTSPDSKPPSSPNRPGSVRRFLSLRSMNGNYRDSSDNTSIMSNGPLSPGSPTSSQNLKKRKSGSWFKRSRSSGRTLDSEVVKENANEKKGPPPPKLPELNTASTSSFEEGLFKDIK